MTLEQYIDTYGLDMDELALALIRRLEHLNDVRIQELKRALMPEAKSAAQDNMLNLVEEASENLKAARLLRESVVERGTITGSVSDVQKALLAADRCLETSSKRFSEIYNVTSQIAIEEAVRETMSEMPEDVAATFLSVLQTKLRNVR